jgi:hypothetical protein
LLLPSPACCFCFRRKHGCKKARGLSSLCEETKHVAQSRRTEVTTLARGLHKELEWIPLKAMRKERTDHYHSAAEDKRGNLYYYIVKQ